jgi:hypothetical protein
MQVHNVRLGFATNSSSSHSLVFLPRAKDKSVEGYEFGWRFFTAASEDAKRMYLAHTIAKALRERVDSETASMVTQQLVGKQVYSTIESLEGKGEGYIDHQSIYSLPYNWEGRGPDYTFVKEFSDFLLQSDLVILGGNDNESKQHPLSRKGKTFVLDIPLDDQSSAWVSRKDKEYGFWTLFNRRTGGKVRFSFPDKESLVTGKSQQEYGGWKSNVAGGVEPQRASVPELVDLKITDFCDRGCSFCYQDSTSEGKHGKWRSERYNYSALPYAFSNLNIFEVAIGGGDPVSHPDFVSILEDFRSYNVVPNFSTRSLRWMDNDRERDRIMEACGNFALSVDSVQEVEELAAQVRVRKLGALGGKYRPNPVVHFVMGTHPYAFKGVLKSAAYHGLHVVLLGYKDSGRGGKQKPEDYSGWVETVTDLRTKGECPGISIDTPLAEKYGKELNEAGVDDVFMQKGEGRFSMYLDLVDNLAGPSSFCGKENMVPIDLQSHSGNIEKSMVRIFNSFKEA